MKCFFCQDEIVKGDKKFWLPLEKPYTNLPFHRECYNNIEENLLEYLKDNYDRILERSRDGRKFFRR